MEINIGRLSRFEGLKENFEFTDTKDGYEIEFCGEKLTTISPLKVIGSAVSFEKDRIDVTVEISAEVERICSRCLEPFTEKINKTTELVFLKEEDAVENDEDHYIYQNDKIELLEIVLSEVASELTMKPLCDTDCKGLCPVCGQNRNNNSCECQKDEYDPRMLILKKLFDTKQGGV